MLLGLDVDNRVIMLQIGAKAFGLQRSPQGELVHARGLLAPVREMVRVVWEFGLEFFGWAGVFEEEDLFNQLDISSWNTYNIYGVPRSLRKFEIQRRTHRPKSFCKHLELILCALGSFLTLRMRSQHLFGELPEGPVLVAKQHHEACCLSIEGAGHVVDCVFNDLLDARVWDGRFVVEHIDGVPVLDGVQEGRAILDRGRHSSERSFCKWW